MEKENQELRGQVENLQKDRERDRCLLDLIVNHLPELKELLAENDLGRLHSYGPGSVYLFVRFSKCQQMEKLWKMYEDGSLKNALGDFLLQ